MPAEMSFLMSSEMPALLAFFWIGSLLLQLAVFFFFRFVDVARHVPAARLGLAELPQKPPPLNLFVPCAGANPGMEAALASLLAQDYPLYNLYLTSHGEDDPAQALAAELASRHPHARHVRAAAARGCSQKNRNLLEALKAADPEAAIHVFCDANHKVAPDFLRQLVNPILLGKARVCSGYRKSELLDCGPESVAFHAINRMLLQWQSLPFTTQPWGGALAVEAKAFAELGVADLWSRTVVDDSSLAGLLLRKKERVLFCPGALAQSRAGGVSRAGLRSWLLRQLLYPKFYTFIPWLLNALALCWFALCLLLSALLLAAFAASAAWAPSWAAVLAGLHFCALLVCQESLRRKIAPQCGPWPWFRGLCLAVAFMYADYLRAALSRKCVWRGYVYHLDRNGLVLGVSRRQEDDGVWR